MKFYLVFTGLGAGNIGDESMMQGFLSLFPLPDHTVIEVWDTNSHALKQFPLKYRYIHYQDEDAFKKLCKNADAVLLVGGTPVMERWGLEWPLKHLSSKLEFCNQNRIPCYAVGVGVDFLEKEESRELFSKGFLPIKVWTVRSVRSRKNLITLGVDPACISVAADLAWQVPLENLNREWAEGFLFNLGVRKDRPLIGVNVVNEIWKDNRAIKEELAKALDYLIESLGWQVGFFCNEVREGEYFDKEASKEVAALMKRGSVIVPNQYFTPQEMVSLLSCCQVTLSWRYHFTLFSYLAGTVSISVIRGEKIKELIEDTNGEHIGEPEQICAERIVEKIEFVQKNIEEIKAFQNIMVEIMKNRSRLNIQFLR
jgi:polysaccharide pyruvyl transferase WcaK-like protein